MTTKTICGFLVIAFCFIFGWWQPAQAMPLGTLLYRTSSDGKIYGYNEKNLIAIDNGFIKNIYTGHVAMYIGQEGGIDYIIEAMPRGLIKVPAKYFINSHNGERFLGAKIPKNLTPLEQEKAVALAKTLAAYNLKYDFDFSRQKGPASGQFTCVGLTEKVYESANITNPKNLQDLVYNMDEYAINITPDGYDNINIYNEKTKDCFAQKLEFSSISRLIKLAAPAPELSGYDAGLIYNGDRYFFLPYTQFLQPTLKDVNVDIPLESYFNDGDIRGTPPQLSLLFKWSLINNPLSSLKIFATKIGNMFNSIFNKSSVDGVIAVTDELAPTLTAVEANNKPSVPKATSKKTTSKKATVKTNTTKKTAIASAPNNSATAISKVAVSANVQEGNPVTKVIKKATTVIKKPAVNSASTTLNQTPLPTVYNNYVAAVEAAPLPVKHQILISKIYTTGSDDFIELFNPNDEAIDLSQENFRIEKTKTADDPVIIMRIGNSLDGYFPGGNEISPHGKYLIVRNEANNEIKDSAQAIATNINFSLEGNGYTIYLGDNAISSDSDADIIDKVGFGSEAKYYFGSGSAPEIQDNQILVRKANATSTAQSMIVGGSDANAGYRFDSQDNTNDFVLISTIKNISDFSNDLDNNTNDIKDNDTSTAFTDYNEIPTTTIPFATSTDASEIASSTDNLNSFKLAVPNIVISKIYTTGDDDYIELYNNGENDFDLAANNYRLEKTKTASDPVILIRFGNLSDGSYPGGTIVKAGNAYLIMRSKIGNDLLSGADAIATGTNFTFEKSGYTIYLGKGPISSPNDIDIVDEVGFGPEAIYYEGSGPAPDIGENKILWRKASSGSTLESMISGGQEEYDGNGYDSNDNAFDFIVFSENGNNISATDISSGLIHLWHFDECRGNILKDSISNLDFQGVNHWSVGKFGCGSTQYYSNSALPINLSTTLNVSNFSLGFYYHSSVSNQKVYIKMRNSATGAIAQMSIGPDSMDLLNFPNIQSTYGLNWPGDQNWHHVFLVIDSVQNNWKLYLDGRELYNHSLGTMFNLVYDSIEVGEINGFDDFDELAIWNRSLSSIEVSDIYNIGSPLEPTIQRPAQISAIKIHHYSFDEGTSTIAYDDIGNDNMQVYSEVWIESARNKSGIFQDMFHASLGVNFSKPVRNEDISIDFWWRSRQGPNTSYCQIALRNDSQNIFVLEPGVYYFSYYFNNSYNIISRGINQILPYDDSWHHIAFVYDSYNYSLNLYIDGKSRMSIPYAWPEAPINNLGINYLNGAYEIDELNIWEGALTTGEVEALAQ